MRRATTRFWTANETARKKNTSPALVAGTGYVLVPRTVPAGTTTEVVRPAVQPAAPAPGPTLVLRLARRDRGFTTHTLQVAIAIASSASQAASLAKTLR